MKQLDIKHIAPYLPYELKVFNEYSDKVETLVSCSDVYVTLFGLHKTVSSQYSYDEIKPLLHPLSMLTSEIEHNGERFVPSDRTIVGMQFGRFERGIGIVQNRLNTNTIYYKDMEYLISLHFDVFNLIPQNLAININTIK